MMVWRRTSRAALVQFQCFREAHKTERGDVWQAFDAGTRLLTQGLAEARRLIAGLDPPLLEELGLVAAIEHLIGHDDLPRAVDIDFRHRLGPRRLPGTLENAAFRIVQESLTNARRHSKSPRIHIDLSVRSGAIRLIVQDWGVGFDPNGVRPEAAGLRGICGRARLLGGETRILSKPGRWYARRGGVAPRGFLIPSVRPAGGLMRQASPSRRRGPTFRCPGMIAFLIDTCVFPQSWFSSPTA